VTYLYNQPEIALAGDPKRIIPVKLDPNPMSGFTEDV